MKRFYHVTTEGDEEGRTTRDLGFVYAESALHAVMYMHSIGKKPYYVYYVSEKESIPEADPIYMLSTHPANVDFDFVENISTGSYRISKKMTIDEKRRLAKEKAHAVLSPEEFALLFDE